MKKVGVFALLFAIFACFATTHANFFYAESAQNTKLYLIPTTYSSESDYQTKYGISADEVYYAKPIDKQTDAIYAGASIFPAHNDNFCFEKTLYAQTTEINQNSSVFVYLFFSTQDTHDLTISAGDGMSSATWSLSSTYLNSQLVQEFGYNIYGWILVELPMAAATIEGDIEEINSLNFVYNSTDGTGDAKLIIFAPYVSTSGNSDVKVVDKQSFYNISYDIGSKKYYADDSLKIANPKEKFKYAYIGDVNYLTSVTSYKMYLSIMNKLTNKTTEYEIGDSPINCTAFNKGEYLIMLVVKNGENQVYAQTLRELYVEQFVPFYIDGGLFDMRVGDEVSYEIKQNGEAMLIRNLTLSGVDGKVAQCEIVDNKVKVKAVGKGHFSVTISGEYTRDGDVFKTFSVTYSSVSNSTQQGTNWWTIGVAAVVTIGGGIAIYFIMRNKRLLKGHYPKY